MKINYKISLITFLFLSLGVNAQFDYQTSTVSESISSINPAIVGSSRTIKLHSTYKKLWNSFETGPEVQEVGGQMPFNFYRMGIGINVARNKLAVEENLRFMLSGSYKIHVMEKAYLSFGLGVGNWWSKRNFDELNIEDLTDKNLADTENLSAFDTWFGVYFFGEDFGIGTSVAHLNRISLNASFENDFGDSFSYSKSPLFSVHAYKKFQLSPSVNIEPFVLIRHANYTNLYFQTLVKFEVNKSIYVGPIVRNNSIGMNMGLALNKFSKRLKNDLKLFYASEYNYKQTNVGKWSHELLLTYEFKKHKKVETINKQDITTSPKGY